MAFNFGNPNSKIKIAAPQVRVVQVAAPKKPTPLPSRERLNALPAATKKDKDGASTPAKPKPAASSVKQKPKARTPPRSPDRLSAPVKRKAVRQASPANPQYRLESSSDEEEEDALSTPVVVSEKRWKGDVERKLRAPPKEGDDGVFKMLHAADLEWPGRKSQVAQQNEVVGVDFQYPSASQRERCVFIWK